MVGAVVIPSGIALEPVAGGGDAFVLAFGRLACLWPSRMYCGGGGKRQYWGLPLHSFGLCLLLHSSHTGQQVPGCLLFPQSLQLSVPGAVVLCVGPDSLRPFVSPGRRMLVLFSHALSALWC